MGQGDAKMEEGQGRGGGKRAEEGGGKSVNKGWRRRGGETHMLRKEALQN